MPEIPEMELYKNNLNTYVKGKIIKDIIVHREKSINLSAQAFKEQVMNKKILAVDRKGKYLIFDIGNEQFLLTHMMLDGRLFFLPPDMAEDQKIDLNDAEGLKKSVDRLPGKPSVIFILSDNAILFFCKLTLGFLHVLNKENLNKVLNNLGRDPLSADLGDEEFEGLLKGKRGMIKPWFMNQKYLAGVGNAYSNEALFEARILPTRQIADIQRAEKKALLSSLKNILHESIKLGGDMEEAFAPWDNFTGGFNAYFKVYDREGQACQVCSNTITRAEVGGRNAFYCSYCQK